MEDHIKRKIKIAGNILFLLYLVVLIYLLFFAEKYGRTFTGREYSYNLVPFKEIKRFWFNRDILGPVAVFTNLAGNVLAFVPFGVVLPVINRHMRGFFQITILSLEFSLMVETIQLIFKVGSFDVDDMFLNTLGGMIGYFIFAACNRLRRKIYG